MPPPLPLSSPPLPQIRARVGGNVKLMTTGASPISDEVMMFLRVCFGAKVVEGYGMTETSCTICLTRCVWGGGGEGRLPIRLGLMCPLPLCPPSPTLMPPSPLRLDDYTTGHVGAPLPSNEVKLVDIPEMSYMSSDKPYPR